MTQENKELLLKDLCARLPYGIKCKVVKYSIDGEMLFIRNELELTVDNVKELVTNNMYEIKPYLFPLSSMTEEQKKEQEAHFTCIKHDMFFSICRYMEWCYKNHLDINDLIPKGLAIDATGLNIY